MRRRLLCLPHLTLAKSVYNVFIFFHFASNQKLYNRKLAIRFLFSFSMPICRWQNEMLHKQPERLQFNSNVVRFACSIRSFYWGETWIVWVCSLTMPSPIFGFSSIQFTLVWFIIMAFPPLTEFFPYRFMSKFTFPNRLDSMRDA